MKLNLKKRLVAKSGKVKSVDFHPSFSWILLGLYNGSISIYDYNTQTSVQYLEVTTFPIRCVKFMPEKNFIICGADDKKIRVYNYNTMEKVKEFEAHTDFIRSIVTHLKEPLILSSSDDNTIKLFDANNNFSLVRSYEEHKDYVMKLAINPKDYSMFASASMDKKIKIWSFNAVNSQLTLEGHLKGCGAVAFCTLADKPYLASGGDDYLVKIWDYTNKHCVFTFKEHEQNISALCFHPEFPILLSASEDQTCKFWNINTGKLEESKIFGYGIVWDITAQSEYNIIGMGCDEATIAFQMGNEEPLMTFSASQSKVIYCQQNNIFSINLKQIQGESKDGEIINIPPKQLGSSEVYPSNISYSPNGRYFAILSDKEFIISTSGVYRSSCVGSCYDLSWNENDSFVVKEGTSVKLYQDLKEVNKFKPSFTFNSVFGGPLFAIKTDDAVYIYDVENMIFIRKIDVVPKKIIWNEEKTLVALICSDGTYILKVNFTAIEEYIDKMVDGNTKGDESGCEDSFEIDYDINESIITGFFINEVFVYQNMKNKVNYAINEKIFPITTLSTNYYLLGYLQVTNRIYLMNKSNQLISYKFPYSFIQYQIAILEKDFEKANKLFDSIPDDFNETIINFLEKFGYNELSYSITKNQNQKFSLALKLQKLTDAMEIAQKENNPEKLKLVADLAFELGEFSFAETAMKQANDYSGLLLFYSSTQNRDKLKKLAEETKQKGVFNISFSSFFQLNDIDNCFVLLMDAKRYPEAAIFCRTYCPNKLSVAIDKWNELIEKEEQNNRMSIRIVNPINEKNTVSISKCETVNMEFYKTVEEGNLDDKEKYDKYLEYDIYGDINGGKNVNIEDVMNK